tara:strand:+ start:823 stop:1329 length:507 start_codon:yes stop_codon:yes gene_type:complete
MGLSIKKNIVKINLFILIQFLYCQTPINQDIILNSQTNKNYKMKKTDSEWRRVLSSAEYHILREKGTERAYTGEYDGHFEDGTYVCAGCGNKLFDSETKYRSGCGWPAFYNAIEGSVEEIEDNSYGMKRIEIICSKCDGHLGHVFNDGPQPSGLRYCINSVSMDFKEK